MSKDCNPALAQAREQIRWYMIGLSYCLPKGNIEIAESAGSGNLVTINGVKGILTAAHVVEKISKQQEVGL